MSTYESEDTAKLSYILFILYVFLIVDCCPYCSPDAGTSYNARHRCVDGSSLRPSVAEHVASACAYLLVLYISCHSSDRQLRDTQRSVRDGSSLGIHVSWRQGPC